MRENALLDAEELRKAVELARRIVREAERNPFHLELQSELEKLGGRWARVKRAPNITIILNRGHCTDKTMRTNRRKGAMPPIVTVIIIVASVVAAALAAYFIYSTTARGVRQVSLTVIGQPTLYAAGTNSVELRATFKNDGTADVDLAGSVIAVQDKNKKAVTFDFGGPTTSGTSCTTDSCKLAPGDSVAVKYTATTTLDQFPDGALATLQTKDGYQTSFAVAKP